MTLRVAFDATPLLGAQTGVGTVTSGLLNGLSERDDVELTAFAQSFRGQNALPVVVPSGVDTTRKPMPAAIFHRLWQMSPAFPIERFTGAVDVVHGTNFVVPPSKGAQLVTVHDLTAVRFPEMCAPASLRYPNLIRAAIKRGAHVHTYSQFVAGEVHEYLGVEPERIHVIGPGLDASTSNDSKPPFVNGRYVLALGTIEPRKDYLGLIRAFDRVASKFDDLQLVIAGARGWGFEEVFAAIDSAQYKARIKYLGRVTDSERAGLLTGASVLAYSSVYEGYGLPPLEAMAAGVPVVATSVGAVPEVVGDAALLVVPSDVDALASGISSVIDDEYLRVGLVERGCARVEPMKWSTAAEQFVDVYRKISA